MLPLVITPQSVRTELSGASMGRFLRKLSPDGTEKGEDAVLESAIRDAQSEVERRAKIYLTQRIIKTSPVEAGLVRGTDYDEEDDPYDFIRGDWGESMGNLRVRRKPLKSVQRIVIRYGSNQSSAQAITIPPEWVVIKRRVGKIHIIPVVGFSAQMSAALLALPLMSIGNAAISVVPGVVTIDYTAGLLPRTFDAQTQDPYEACPDDDPRFLLVAVRYFATSYVLRSLSRAWLPFGGSISMDGLSQSVNTQAFDGAIKDYETKADSALGQYNRPGLKFFMQ